MTRENLIDKLYESLKGPPPLFSRRAVRGRVLDKKALLDLVDEIAKAVDGRRGDGNGAGR